MATTARMGRPVGGLTPTRRTQLRRIVRRMRRAEQNALDVRGELATAVTEAQSEGASVRMIGEALGYGSSTIHALIHRGESTDDEE